MCGPDPELSRTSAERSRAHLTWIVVSTHPHQEERAISNLTNQGYITYCPTILVHVRHARKVAEVRRPLFPGYVFVCLDPDRHRWKPIQSTFGVRAVVCNGVVPCRLDDRFLAGLRAREVDGAIVRSRPPYVVGQAVRISGGALDGLAAEVVALDEKNRVVVLLDMLNRSVRAQVDPLQLRSA